MGSGACFGSGISGISEIFEAPFSSFLSTRWHKSAQQRKLPFGVLACVKCPHTAELNNTHAHTSKAELTTWKAGLWGGGLEAMETLESRSDKLQSTVGGRVRQPDGTNAKDYTPDY